MQFQILSLNGHNQCWCWTSEICSAAVARQPDTQSVLIRSIHTSGHWNEHHQFGRTAFALLRGVHCKVRTFSHPVTCDSQSQVTAVAQLSHLQRIFEQPLARRRLIVKFEPGEGETPL